MRLWFQRVMNNSLTRSAYYTDLSVYPEAHCVMLMNPLSADLNCMRHTLLFGGLESIEYNMKRKKGNIRFYESVIAMIIILIIRRKMRPWRSSVRITV